VRKKSLRNDKVEAVFRPGHADVKQAALLFDFVRRAGAQIGGDAAVNDVEDEDRFPLLPIC